jgi:hypothetical protein
VPFASFYFCIAQRAGETPPQDFLFMGKSKNSRKGTRKKYADHAHTDWKHQAQGVKRSAVRSVNSHHQMELDEDFPILIKSGKTWWDCKPEKSHVASSVKQ